MSPRRDGIPRPSPRNWERYPHLRELSLLYEGRNEDIVVRPPDISSQGMFINTPSYFPEGAVLKLKFKLTRSNVEIDTRGEVRYCLPGVGIGVEFVHVTPGLVRAIENEIRATKRSRPRRA